MSDPENVFDLAGSYPLKCRIVGVLAPTASADDSAVFVDLKTQWIMEGLGHGHEAANSGVDGVRRVDDFSRGRPRCDGSGVTLPGNYPGQCRRLSFPSGHRRPADQCCLDLAFIRHGFYSVAGDYQDASQLLQVIRPTEVVDSMMAWVLRVRSFLDWNYFLVALAVGSFLLLIVLLSLKLREEECGILRDLGGARSWIFRLMLLEWGALLLASGLVAFGMARVLGFLLQHWLERSL